MKKILLFVLIAVGSLPLFAGGMQHNTNQSAQWVRTLSRDATTEIDAVFFNPAGLTKLADGFHFSLHSQTISQTRTVTSENPMFNSGEFKGETFVPAIPTFFAAYKTGKLAVSSAFVIVGGGGSASFDAGVPSFEQDIAAIPSLLSAKNIPTTEYSNEMTFSRSSSYFGIQLGASYAINDMVSVFLGGRYVMAPSSLNTTVGSIKNIMINPNKPNFNTGSRIYDGRMNSATLFFEDAARILNAVDVQVRPAGDALQPIITGGGGSVPLANGTAAGLSAAQVAQLQGTITATGGNPTGMTIEDAQKYFYSFKTNADAMTYYSIATKDKEIDVSQSGSGFTPILGVNLSLMEEKLNIGIKYEHTTVIKLKNATVKDETPTKMFPDGEENHSDLPAYLSIGASYKATEKVEISCGYHQYFDRPVKYYDNEKTNAAYLTGNAMELALGAQYKAMDKLTVSAGYLFAGVMKKPEYQSDMSNSLTSHTFGLGGQYLLTENLDLNLGFLFTSYVEATNDYETAVPTKYKETYGKSNILFAIGFGYRLTK